LLGIAICNFAFAALTPPLVGAIALLLALYLCFGLGNGATFQLVPHRWRDLTGLMAGVIGAAGGVGGFYVPVVTGIARQATDRYQLGFVAFGLVAAIACVTVVGLRREWLAWARPAEERPPPGAPAGRALVMRGD
jgi:MFS transporter, NNP family, nitrate/nitrite transporter